MQVVGKCITPFLVMLGPRQIGADKIADATNVKKSDAPRRKIGLPPNGFCMEWSKKKISF